MADFKASCVFHCFPTADLVGFGPTWTDIFGSRFFLFDSQNMSSWQMPILLIPNDTLASPFL